MKRTEQRKQIPMGRRQHPPPAEASAHKRLGRGIALRSTPGAAYRGHPPIARLTECSNRRTPHSGAALNKESPAAGSCGGAGRLSGRPVRLGATPSFRSTSVPVALFLQQATGRPQPRLATPRAMAPDVREALSCNSSIVACKRVHQPKLSKPHPLRHSRQPSELPTGKASASAKPKNAINTKARLGSARRQVEGEAILSLAGVGAGGVGPRREAPRQSLLVA